MKCGIHKSHQHASVISVERKYNFRGMLKFNFGLEHGNQKKVFFFVVFYFISNVKSSLKEIDYSKNRCLGY